MISIRLKGGAGSGFHGHAGRPGKIGGSSSSGAGSRLPVEQRVWQGQKHEGSRQLTNQQTGEIGEALAEKALEEHLGADFSNLNEDRNNMAADLVGDHTLIEVKAGPATNVNTAQHWRATISTAGKSERELIRKMTKAEKRAHNEYKAKQVLERKQALLDKMSEMAGAKVKPMTVGIVLTANGDRGDVFFIPGFHLRLRWQDYATDEYYVGTYEYGATVQKGGAGSGFHDHAGRPGKIGGSASGHGAIGNNAHARDFVDKLVSKKGRISAAGNTMPQERSAYFESLGYTSEEVKSLETLLDAYGYGSEAQQYAEQTILQHLRDNDRMGQLLGEQIALETAFHDAYIDHLDVLRNKQLDDLRSNFEWGWESHAGVTVLGAWYGPDNMFPEPKEKVWAAAVESFNLEFEDRNATLYRKGKMDRPIQSWTMNEEGAMMEGRFGSGIGWDTRIPIESVRDRGYLILGGWSKLMGAPGEAERTLIRMEDV